MKKSKEYQDGFRQGVLSIPPNLGMWNRESCCQGYIDGSKARKEVLLDVSRSAMWDDDLIERLLAKV